MNTETGLTLNLSGSRDTRSSLMQQLICLHSHTDNMYNRSCMGEPRISIKQPFKQNKLFFYQITWSAFKNHFNPRQLWKDFTFIWIRLSINLAWIFMLQISLFNLLYKKWSTMKDEIMKTWTNKHIQLTTAVWSFISKFNYHCYVLWGLYLLQPCLGDGENGNLFFPLNSVIDD